VSRRVVVIGSPIGRLANRLLLFAHVAASAAEHGFLVVNPHFGPYAHYFPATAREVVLRYPEGRRVWVAPRRPLRRVFRRAALAGVGALEHAQRLGLDTGVIRINRQETLDLGGDAFLAALSRHRLLVLRDWFFRTPALVERHRDELRRFFAPHPQFAARADAAVAAARGGRDRLVVGVHVRQGDYRIYKDGRFFFTHAEYRGLLERTQAAFPERELTFLLSSDERIPLDAFAGLDVHVAPGHELADMLALAGCDLVLGPPSTFSRWASFWGATPLALVSEAAASIAADDFRPRLGLSDWPLT
jgi:hypothetical protein